MEAIGAEAKVPTKPTATTPSAAAHAIASFPITDPDPTDLNSNRDFNRDFDKGAPRGPHRDDVADLYAASFPNTVITAATAATNTALVVTAAVFDSARALWVAPRPAFPGEPLHRRAHRTAQLLMQPLLLLAAAWLAAADTTVWRAGRTLASAGRTVRALPSQGLGVLWEGAR